jgi:hypothetical protein
MHPLETYLSALYDARLGGGVAETSGYAALANLLNEVGGGLKPWEAVEDRSLGHQNALAGAMHRPRSRP